MFKSSDVLTHICTFGARKKDLINCRIVEIVCMQPIFIHTSTGRRDAGKEQQKNASKVPRITNLYKKTAQLKCAGARKYLLLNFELEIGRVLGFCIQVDRLCDRAKKNATLQILFIRKPFNFNVCVSFFFWLFLLLLLLLCFNVWIKRHFT